MGGEASPSYDFGTLFRVECLTADGGAKMTDKSDEADVDVDVAVLPFFAVVDTFLVDFGGGFNVSTLLSMAVSTVAFTAAS